MKKEKIKYLFYVLFLVIIDQITKIFISNIGNLYIIKNFLNFVYIRNNGAAFGILSNNRILIIVINILLIIYLVYDSVKNRKNKLEYFSYSLIVSGAVGNLIDRICFGYVRDFISFTLFNRQMAIFNFADICITFGVIIYLYLIVRDGSNEGNSN